MTWFRVDDKFGEHPKVRAIPRAHRRNAIGLWLLAGVWCASQVLTTDGRDGNVPSYMIDELCSDTTDAHWLAHVGLWHAAGHDCEACEQPIDPDGWLFHEWESLQYTAEQIKEKRAADAERQRAHRDRKRAEREGSPRHATVTRDTSVSHGTVQPSRPVPSRPDPSPESVVNLGGHRYETLPPAAATEPPEEVNAAGARCARHRGMIGDPGPCRGCMRAREAAEQAQAAAEAETIRRRLECQRCGGHGFIEDADGRPVEKCDHRPFLEVVSS